MVSATELSDTWVLERTQHHLLRFQLQNLSSSIPHVIFVKSPATAYYQKGTHQIFVGDPSMGHQKSQDHM